MRKRPERYRYKRFLKMGSQRKTLCGCVSVQCLSLWQLRKKGRNVRYVFESGASGNVTLRELRNACPGSFYSLGNIIPYLINSLLGLLLTDSSFSQPLCPQVDHCKLREGKTRIRIQLSQDSQLPEALLSQPGQCVLLSYQFVPRHLALICLGPSLVASDLQCILRKTSSPDGLN